MSFQKNVSTLVASSITFAKATDRAVSQKWGRDSKVYVATLNSIDAMHADGCALEAIRKELMGCFRVAIEENPDIESDLKAQRAVFKPLFKSGLFGTGFDWAEYVAGFETQDAWRKAHRKTGKARAGKGEGGKGEADAEQVADAPKTDPERVASMLAILSGCDDIPGAVAEFIEGASSMIEG